MRIRPERLEDFSPAQRALVMKRSTQDVSSVYEDVRRIVEDVKKRGDEALLEMNRTLKPGLGHEDLKVVPREVEEAYRKVDGKVVECLKKAGENIRKFHTAQMEQEMWAVEVAEGILAGRITRPMDSVGCYVPGGRAAYPSTVLMTVIPAKVAGVTEILIATPPGAGMEINPATLVAADIAGCDRIFKVGGPWGIAAMAYGTESVPSVDKIVGPGNKYVTAAKMIVYGQVDIDSPAGPSEALILADDTADPSLIVADFLAQIEHDPDSASVLVSTSREVAEEVCVTIEREFETLPRKEILSSSLMKHSRVLIARDLGQAIDFANQYAAEHLQIITRDPFMVLPRIRHAGSIFLGPFAPVPAGDYASGTNHVLPTGRYARMFSGLSVDDFLKKPTFQYLSKEGLFHLKEIITTLAEVEGLPLHARAVQARFK